MKLSDLVIITEEQLLDLLNCSGLLLEDIEYKYLNEFVAHWCDDQVFEQLVNKGYEFE